MKRGENGRFVGLPESERLVPKNCLRNDRLLRERLFDRFFGVGNWELKACFPSCVSRGLWSALSFIQSEGRCYVCQTYTGKPSRGAREAYFYVPKPDCEKDEEAFFNQRKRDRTNDCFFLFTNGWNSIPCQDRKAALDWTDRKAEANTLYLLLKRNERWSEKYGRPYWDLDRAAKGAGLR